MNSLTNSNKKKFYLLIFGVIILGLASYSFAIGKTIDEHRQFANLSDKVEVAKSLTADLKKWQALNHQLDERLGGEMVLSGFQESLLGSVGKFCSQKDLTLSDFSEPFEGFEGGYSIETIILKIEGDFKPMLELVHHLETRFKGGKVASVSFFKEKNYRKNREELFLELYIQKVKIYKDENV